MIFRGPAGTGKTYLAVEAAKLAAAEGKKVLFLCFNHRLGVELKTIAGESANVTVDTIYKHMCILLNIQPELCEAKAEDGEFWSSIPEQAVSALLEGNARCGYYDYLVLDEAQDLLKSEFLDYLDLLLKGGLKAGKWLFTGDFNHQNIYNRDALQVEEFLSYRLQTNYSTFSLFDNLRNQKRIADLAERCLQQSCYGEIKRNDNSNTPTVLYYRTREEQQKHLQDSVRGLLAKGFIPEEIAILSYRKNQHSAVSGLTENELGVMSGDFRESPIHDRILAGSIHGFKGCERPAVIVTDIDDLSNQVKRGLLYLGASRAQDDLILIARSSERKRMNAILSNEK